MALGEMGLVELGLGEMGLGEMGQNRQTTVQRQHFLAISVATSETFERRPALSALCRQMTNKKAMLWQGNRMMPL